MATATKKKPATTKLVKKKSSGGFLEDLRDKADKNGKALDELGFGDILKQLEKDGEIMSAAELGSGWAIVNNKEKGRLVGVPLLILSFQFNEGDNGEFVSAQVLTNTERLIVNDGSTGIYAQLHEIAEAGNVKAIYCKHGLRESKYEYEDPKTGEKKPASTFYIDTSA
jgi:hypothetical protein